MCKSIFVLAVSSMLLGVGVARAEFIEVPDAVFCAYQNRAAGRAEICYQHGVWYFNQRTSELFNCYMGSESYHKDENEIEQSIQASCTRVYQAFDAAGTYSGGAQPAQPQTAPTVAVPNYSPWVRDAVKVLWAFDDESRFGKVCRSTILDPRLAPTCAVVTMSPTRTDECEKVFPFRPPGCDGASQQEECTRPLPYRPQSCPEDIGDPVVRGPHRVGHKNALKFGLTSAPPRGKVTSASSP
jgi:hypothetical protein